MTINSPTTSRVVAVIFGVIACGAAMRGQQVSAPLHLIVRERHVETFQQEVQRAADRGYRISAELFDVGLGAVLESHPGEVAPVEYLVLSTQKTSTLDAELTAAAAVGFRLTSVLRGTNILVERPKGSTTPTHQYRILATELRGTLEDELRAPGSVGFHVAGQGRAAGGLVNDIEFMAVLERPIGEADRVRVSYHLIDAIRVATLQRELQDAADRGYRLVPSEGAWDSAVLLEKPEGSETLFEYRVLSERGIDGMQKAMDAAAAAGYAFSTVLGGNVKNETVLVMERPKGTTIPTREQRIVLWKGTTMMGRRNLGAERDLLAELARGFRLAGETTFARFWSATGSDPVLILERGVRVAQ